MEEVPENQLVVFDQAFTPAKLFMPGTMDPLLGHIRKEVMAELTDPTTTAGRERIKSLAFKVVKTKTAIESARKTLVADEKARLSAIDAEGRRIREALDTLAKEVRQPVTEYEEREKLRVTAHEDAINNLRQLNIFGPEPGVRDFEERLSIANQFNVNREEFTTQATDLKKEVVKSLTAKLEAAKKAEADRLELEKLRAEAEERAIKEREAKAAAEAKAEAEKVAKAKAAAAKKAAQDRADRLMAEAKEREDALKAARKKAEEDAARAQREKDEAAAEAERQATLAREEAERQATAAAQAERDRIEAERKAEEEATAKREANTKHKAKVNNEVLDALVDAGVRDAKKAVEAIAKGLIPHVTITY